MAGKSDSNRNQKNNVRVALATAATIATLIGAQSLAFAGNTTSNVQAQSEQPQSALSDVVDSATTQLQLDDDQPVIIATPTAMPTTTQITTTSSQPKPRSRSSR